MLAFSVYGGYLFSPSMGVAITWTQDKRIDAEAPSPQSFKRACYPSNDFIEVGVTLVSLSPPQYLQDHVHASGWALKWPVICFWTSLPTVAYNLSNYIKKNQLYIMSPNSSMYLSSYRMALSSRQQAKRRGGQIVAQVHMAPLVGSAVLEFTAG